METQSIRMSKDKYQKFFFKTFFTAILRKCIHLGIKNPYTFSIIILTSVVHNHYYFHSYFSTSEKTSRTFM